MLIVGLTGGIGAGKSLVAQYFSNLGAKVLDADNLARAAIERGTSGFDEVIVAFGDSILKNGEIDRRALAEKIFSDSNLKTILEKIVHPRVREGFELAVSALTAKDVLIYEIPLLVEVGAADRFDFIIAVESELDLRLDRLEKRGMNGTEISARIAAQASTEERKKIADYVIFNNASTDELLREVEYLWEVVLPPLQHAKP